MVHVRENITERQDLKIRFFSKNTQVLTRKDLFLEFPIDPNRKKFFFTDKQKWGKVNQIKLMLSL